MIVLRFYYRHNKTDIIRLIISIKLCASLYKTCRFYQLYHRYLFIYVTFYSLRQFYFDQVLIIYFIYLKFNRKSWYRNFQRTKINLLKLKYTVYSVCLAISWFVTKFQHYFVVLIKKPSRNVTEKIYTVLFYRIVTLQK